MTCRQQTINAFVPIYTCIGRYAWGLLKKSTDVLKWCLSSLIPVKSQWFIIDSFSTSNILTWIEKTEMKEFPVNSRFTHVDKEHLSRHREKSGMNEKKRMLHVIFLDLLNNFHAKKRNESLTKMHKRFFLYCLKWSCLCYT
jgi:hypothetical protein